MKHIKLAVIADDFTGGADAASFLKRKHANVVLLTGIPQTLPDCDCVVFALKIRSIPVSDALKKVHDVLLFLDQYHVEHLYYKYCSTFDSTPKGNIGPVMDFLLDYYDLPYSILCPSLPVNGRTVENGILYVNHQKLSESPLKDHPLNPMWDSYIPKIMELQSKYPCFVLKRNESLTSFLEERMRSDSKFYIVPDYSDSQDAKRIVSCFGDNFLYSGGNGLLEFLFDFSSPQENFETSFDNRTIILCGSCSKATRLQIQHFSENYECLSINESSDDLTYITSLIDEQKSPLLIYSDAVLKNFKTEKKSSALYTAARKIESILSSIAVYAKDHNYHKIIVAGGETSGAVTSRLGYTAFYIGQEICPGVPVLIPEEDEHLQLILKSGNFGGKDFFLKAMNM